VVSPQLAAGSTGAGETCRRSAPGEGVVRAAQVIKRRARRLATDRGIDCVELDSDERRGIESTELHLS